MCVGGERVGTLLRITGSLPLPLLCAPRSCAPPSFHLTSLFPPALPPPAPRCPCCRLGEIQSVAGQAAPRQEVLDALVGGDFDPEEYDRQMAAAFGEDYYGAVSALGRLAVGAPVVLLRCAVLCCAV